MGVLLGYRLFQLLMLPLVCAAASAAAAPPGCRRRCGEVDVPYPFGIGHNCAMEGFLLDCNTTDDGLEKLFVFNVEITNISLPLGQARMLNEISWQCYNGSNKSTNYSDWYLNFVGTPYRFSDVHNKFTVIGCETLAYIGGRERNDSFWSGCVSVCYNEESLVNNSCSGIGCCQTAIPKDLAYYEVQFASNFNSSSIWNFSPCSYAVFNGKAPLVVDWAIGNETCQVAQRNITSYACISEHSECLNSSNGPGYLCSCSSGYHGNPYVAQGCQDIDECSDNDQNPCHGICQNLPGNFSCFCPRGTYGDAFTGTCTHTQHQKLPSSAKVAIGRSLFSTTAIGREQKTSNKSPYLSLFLNVLNFYFLFFNFNNEFRPLASSKKVLKTSCVSSHPGKSNLCIGSGLIFLLISGMCIYVILQRRKLIKIKERYFREHGGWILLEEIKAKERYFREQGLAFKIFAKEELEKATEKYDKNRVLGRGGHGTVYKGDLEDSRVINHKNIVKLLGCCLEVEVPMLVYEFVSNGTLFQLIHDNNRASPFSLATRLRIAHESAEALAYLHSSASPPIIHGDVKSSNILLDENYTAKVSDFGASKLVPKDEDQFATLPIYFEASEDERSLASCFILATKENRLMEILDDQVRNEGDTELIQEMSELAKQCLKFIGEERPTMKEVAEELDRLRKFKQHPWVPQNTEEIESLLKASQGRHPSLRSFVPARPLGASRENLAAANGFLPSLRNAFSNLSPPSSSSVPLASLQVSLVNSSCSGIGCCQTSIPKDLTYYEVWFDSNFNSSSIWNFSDCSYAVLLEANRFEFLTSYITTYQFWNNNNGKAPLVVDWAIGNETCEVAQRNTTSYACISEHSKCLNSSNGPGYLCNCSSGYHGNPYVAHGCQGL
ncbi:unnamed protein product, partial [Musa acuminata subsp. burmannicoides]